MSTTLRLLLTIATLLSVAMAPTRAAQPSVAAPAPELSFRDFFHLPVGPTGLALSERLRQAQGQTVRLVGYMVQQENPLPGRFMLTPRPVQMSEHADGDADDLPPATVTVYLDPSQSDWKLPHTRGLVAVTGELAVGRLEESDGRVSWVRLRLNSEAIRGMTPFELANYQHSLQHRH